MISTIALLVLTFTVLGLLLGIAALYDAPITDDRNPAIQQELFEECKKEQTLDGELTQDEYDRCAYSIYD